MISKSLTTIQSRRDFLVKSAKTGLSLSLFSSGLSLDCHAATRLYGNGATIPTMKGSISSKDFGVTLIHEHLLFGDIPKEKEKESIAFAVSLLKEAERVGINTIVDLSPTRDIRLYLEIASQTSINIIVSTGSYIHGWMPESITKLSEEQYKDRLREELTKGIQGTSIRAGIIKVAGQKTPLTEWEQMVFRAAATVQQELKVPIATHAIFKPEEQFKWLVKNGADPTKLFFSHTEAKFGWGGLNREQMGEQLLRIARGGGHMMFNNFGYEFDTPWEDLVYLIRLLCDQGLRDKVLISADCYWHWKNGKMIVNVDDVRPETRNKTYAYMMTDAVPDLLKAGFSAKDIQAFLVENPVRFFS